MLKSASLAEIKTELQTLPQEELLAICLRLARFKRDNKELMGFLLFQSHNLDDYTTQVCGQMTQEFTQINTSNIWFAKKTIRKVLRTANKYAKYAGSKEVEISLLMHFLVELKQLPANILNAPVIKKLQEQQLKKIRKLVDGLHEDLQYDWQRQLEAI